MGLDQLAFSMTAFEVENEEEPGNHDISHEWRKHPNLQGWMEELWRSKGLSKTGEWNEFNCCPLELTKEDIIRLKKDVESQDLPKTEGFFFGSDADKEYKEQDLEFCDWALKEIKEGRKVFYDSWW